MSVHPLPAAAEQTVGQSTNSGPRESPEEDPSETHPAQDIQRVLQMLKTEDNAPMSESQELAVPLSEWEKVLVHLRENSHQPDLWLRLVELAEKSGDTQQVQVTYDALLEAYPGTSGAQIAYIDHYLQRNMFKKAEDLFQKFLRKSPAIDLWKHYLNHVRRMNVDPSQRDMILKSYEFALNHVGHDKDSSSIWVDYIRFIESGEVSNPRESSLRMDALRKVYHRVLQIPVENIESLWSDYEAFENGLNKLTAKKFLQDLNPVYMQARTVLRQLNKHLGPLYALPSGSSTHSQIYLPPAPTFHPDELARVWGWKNYIKWEESNPLEIEDKDRAVLTTRIQGVYRKAVVRQRFYGEIWYMAYIWTISVGKPEEALGILKAGIEANPSSYVLNFALAETLESKKEYAEVHAAFDRFLSVLRSTLDTLQSQILPNEIALNSQTSTDTAPATANGNVATEGGSEQAALEKDIKERKTEFGLAYIMYMRFGRRAEGLDSARGVFKKARKERWCPWEVYEASALLEYHTTKKTDVAGRIFEKGLEMFGSEIEFVLRYLGFLITVNDQNNARALFERIIDKFDASVARPLWERWARHEYQYGDLESAQKLEKRISEVYPNDPPIKLFAQRHTYLGTDAIAARDLGLAAVRQASNGSSPFSSQNPQPNTSRMLGRNDTAQSILVATGNSNSPSSLKRPPSPDLRRRGEELRGALTHKRQRAASPPRERERDRWDGPGRRRFGSPMRDREHPHPAARRDRERDEERPPTVPPVVSWFLGQLPSPKTFDGVVFRTDDLMSLFRSAIIPSSGPRPRSSPPPPPQRAGGRPPPDYGPYQGPGGGRQGRRF